MQGDGGEAERAGEDGEALGLVHGAAEDYGLGARVLVQEVDEVEIFVLLGEEEIVLEEGGDGLVLGGDGDANGVSEGGALEGFDFGGHGCGEEVGAPGFSR